MAAGSTPSTFWKAVPATVASVARTRRTAATPGCAATARASSGLSAPSSPPGWTYRSARLPRSMATSAVRLTDAVSTAVEATSARPTISAAAVTAVRLGLRIAFSRASRPELPRSLHSGAPTPQESGRATSGPSVVTPRKTASAPPPASARPAPRCPSRPAASEPAPSARTPAPTARRRLEKGDGVAAASRSAASEATRVALRAGATAAATVTATPSPTAIAAALARNWRSLVGRSMPAPPSRAPSPLAARTPSARPVSEATVPTASASTSTERSTWPRLAPSARSRASSRVRCATRIEKVFQMMKEATNSETSAKASRALVRKPSDCSSWEACAAAAEAAVTASTPPGSTAATRSRRTVALTPAAARRSISSKRPCLPNRRCAVFVSNSARLATPGPSPLPNPVMALTVNGRAAPPATTRTRSPTCRRWPRAVAASTAISPSPAGGCPSRSV